MSSIQDDRGYNQGYRPSRSLEVRTRRRFDYILGKMDLPVGANILEIGCGTGELAYLMARATGGKVIGLDLCAQFIEQARASYSAPNLKFKVLNFNNADSVKEIIAECEFDYVVGNGILHHLYHRLDESLSNIHSLLGKNGKIVFLEPNFYNPYCLLIFNVKALRKITRLEPEEMTFTKEAIIWKLQKASFSDINVEYRDFLVPGTPEFLIKPMVLAGDVIEKIPVLNMMAQSIYISARKQT